MIDNFFSVEGCGTIGDLGYWVTAWLSDGIQRTIVTTRALFARLRLGTKMHILVDAEHSKAFNVDENKIQTPQNGIDKPGKGLGRAIDT